MDHTSQKIYLSSIYYISRLFILIMTPALIFMILKNSFMELLGISVMPFLIIIIVIDLLPDILVFHCWLHKISIIEITNTGIIDRRILTKEICWGNIQRAYKRDIIYKNTRRLVVISLKNDLSPDSWKPFIRIIYSIKRIRKEIEIDDICLEIKRDKLFDMIKKKIQLTV